jgi:tetratricopeptide (TPR) repeat protein
VKSANWRATWLSIARSTMTSKENAAAWIEQISPNIPQDSMVEQYVLAQAWYDAGQKFSEMSYVNKAYNILTPLISRDDVKPAILLLAGRTDEVRGDLASAEAAYRKLVSIEPKAALGLNNLAYVLYLENKDLKEAATLATSAIALAPATSDYHDTLARVHAKLGQTDLATKSFQEALRLEPNKLDTLIGLADTFTRGGQRNKAADLLEQIDSLLPVNRPLPAAEAEQLRSVREAIKTRTGSAASTS